MHLNEPLPRVRWREGELERSAQWRSERRYPPPKRLMVVDDSLAADRALHEICQGTTLLWRGDYHLAKQLLQALGRRIEATGRGRGRRRKGGGVAETVTDVESYHRHRLRRSRRARLMSRLVVPMDADYRLALRRAPEVCLACREAWGVEAEGAADSEDVSHDAADPGGDAGLLLPLTDLLGILGAHQWRHRGVPVEALGPPPGNRIFPHYGVFAPTRQEYVQLVRRAPLPTTTAPGVAASPYVAFDIGTGTGVLAAVLARRSVDRIVATDVCRRALDCAADNVRRLGLEGTVEVLANELFPPGLASLVVCNPPWLPGRPGTSLEGAVYDPESRMLKGFLAGLGDHLLPGGEGWLILSDLAEHLGLRSRQELLRAIAEADLRVVERLDAKASHGKVSRTEDPLHRFRAAETTSLWRLASRT